MRICLPSNAQTHPRPDTTHSLTTQAIPINMYLLMLLNLEQGSSFVTFQNIFPLSWYELANSSQGICHSLLLSAFVSLENLNESSWILIFYLPQYSCLENPTDRRAWQATVHRVSKSQTQLRQLSTHASLHLHCLLFGIWKVFVFTEGFPRHQKSKVKIYICNTQSKTEKI